MRTVKEFTTGDGQRRFRVRYREGEVQTSKTFRHKKDATTFAAVLDAGGVSDAMAWLEAREKKAAVITFAEWYESYVEQLTGVTDRTREDYLSLRRRYLTDLDPLPLDLITRAHITTIVNGMERAGRAPKTIKQAINTLSSCLQLAVDERHMQTNPCRRVRLPRAQIGGEPRFLSHEEFANLYDATPEHYRPLVSFLFGTGMRWSEATAIFARHVDLKAGTIRVEQAWKRVPGKGMQIGAPKTERSKRTVNAAVAALVAIEPLLRRPADHVFITAAGGPVLHANFYNNVWQPTCRAAGLATPLPKSGARPPWDGPRIHDARHTHASWLISDGIQLEAVQDQLGHESILTTRKIYGHLLPALGVAVGKSASAAMERALAINAGGSAAQARALAPSSD